MPVPHAECLAAVDALRSGAVVALPSEATYVLAFDAANADALMRARAALPITVDQASTPLGAAAMWHAPYVFAARDAVSRVRKHDLPLPAMRLAERYWPGPLTLVLPGDTHPRREQPSDAPAATASGPLSATAEATADGAKSPGRAVRPMLTGRKRHGRHDVVGEIGGKVGIDDSAPADILVDTGLALRVLADATATTVLSLAAEAGMLVRAVATDATDATEVRARFAAIATLVLDAGPTPLAEPATVVACSHGATRVIASGAIDTGAVARAALTRVCFVCTGNICRSPMAEALLVALAHRDAGMLLGEAYTLAFEAQSCGTDVAMLGHAVTGKARDVLEALNADRFVADHQARPCDPDRLRQMDTVYVMTHRHREDVLALVPDIGDRVHVLDPAGMDIDDPWGLSIGKYEEAALQIESALRDRFF